MRRKKILISVFLAAVVVLVLLIFLPARPSAALNKLEQNQVTSADISYAEGYYTVTDEDDLRQLVEFLQSMKLRPCIPKDLDGGFGTLTIWEESRQTNIFISESYIKINHMSFRPDRNYCDALRKIFSELEEHCEVHRQ